MTEPLTAEREAQIRWRREQYLLNHSHSSAFACCTAHGSADDVPALLAEVDRLRAEVAKSEDDLHFLHDNTIPELRRNWQSEEDGKKRWRERAETAEAELAARPSRAEVLAEVYAAIKDPAQRRAVGGGLGWETARDVVHNLHRQTEAGVS